MRVEHRQIGDVFVIDVKGSLTELEYLMSVRGLVGAALEQQFRKIVLNLEHVSYINSANLGEIVRCYTLARMSGALLVLCHPSKRVSDLFSITKLLSLFEIHDSLEGALQFYADDMHLEVTCPRSGPDTWIRFSPLSEYQKCPLCGLELKISSPVPTTEAPITAVATAFRLPTYDGEWISVAIGTPTVVAIDGRLDLFAAEAVEQAVTLLPAPHDLLFSLSTGDVSEAGLATLVRLCEATAGQTVISLEGIPSKAKPAWRNKAAFTRAATLLHDTDDDAARSFDRPSSPGALSVMVRRQPL